MATIDIIIIILLILGAYRGYSTGLLMQLLGFAAFFLAIIGGFHFMHWGIVWLRQYVGNYESVLPVISFLAIFITILVVINLLGKTLKSVLDMTLLGGFDDMAGALTGLLKWAIGISMIFWLAETYTNIPIAQYAEGALVFPAIAPLAPILFDFLSILLPIVQDFSGNEYDQALLILEGNDTIARDFFKIVV